MIPRSRRSPLHATRAGVGGAWCLALGAVPLCSEHPALLVAVLAVEIAAALAAGLGPELRRTAAWGVPFALAVVAINALVTRDGATVLFRGPHLPWAGPDRHHARGARLRRRARAADPRDLRHRGVPAPPPSTPTSCCAALRRVSLRSGVTAALAMRLFGVLRRDAAAPRRRAALPARRRRLADRGAARGHRPARSTARPTSPRRSRSAASAPAAGRRGCRGPWSRHDLAFAASARRAAGDRRRRRCSARGASSRPTRG